MFFLTGAPLKNLSALGDILHLQLHYVAVLSEEEEKLVVVNSVAFEVEKVKIYLNNDLKSEYTVMPPPPMTWDYVRVLTG